MIRPTGERVAVRVDRKHDFGERALLVPDLGDARNLEGVVVARGRDAPPELAEGARVLFHRYVGAEIVRNGTVLTVLEPDEIYATVDA